MNSSSYLQNIYPMNVKMKVHWHIIQWNWTLYKALKPNSNYKLHYIQHVRCRLSISNVHKYGRLHASLRVLRTILMFSYILFIVSSKPILFSLHLPLAIDFIVKQHKHIRSVVIGIKIKKLRLKTLTQSIRLPPVNDYVPKYEVSK